MGFGEAGARDDDGRLIGRASAITVAIGRVTRTNPRHKNSDDKCTGVKSISFSRVLEFFFLEDGITCSFAKISFYARL